MNPFGNTNSNPFGNTTNSSFGGGVSSAPAHDDDTLGWEDGWYDDEEFVLIPEGTYQCQIAGMEKGRFDGSEKSAACPTTILTVKVAWEDKIVTVKHTIFMRQSQKWQISNLFKSCGFPVQDGKVQVKWNELPGKACWCDIVHKEGKKAGSKFHNIGKFKATAQG